MATRLQFYCYEIKSDEQLDARWAQAVGAMHRLRCVCDELTESATDPKIERTLERLAYNVENYLVRTYELRERIICFVATLSGASSQGARRIGRNLKSAEKRKLAIANVREVLPKMASPLESLLDLLDNDINMRNFHTHDTFLQIGMWAENDVHDPADALLDLHGQARKRLETFLRKEARRFAREYERKADRIIRSATALVESATSFGVRIVSLRLSP
jgi:hypothetical protein